MKLSIVIVNYNVKHFLKKLLQSVEKSVVNFEYEVFIVDNNSVDGSTAMVKAEYSNIHLIENNKNVGFSSANNQAIRVAKGEYILLLNPDTIVQEDTFQKVVDFMDAHDDAGGLGIKMIDGKGKFLPESKRGLPTPKVAFYKMTGLSKLFPKSKTFGRYHLSFLNENETHEIDVLSGAFMLLRKSALDKVGLLDEQFFMYGEDIDLSYRIQKGGYKNYYLPTTEIIHYKGESTKKGSLNYVRIFYSAMIIFIEKHFKNSRLITSGLKVGIYARALAAGLGRIFKKIFWPALDASLIFLIFFGLKFIWEEYVKAASNTTYPISFLRFNIPLYISIWLASIFYAGGYDKPLKLKKLTIGLVIGTLLIAAVYGFLDMRYRSSRGMIIAGAVISVALLSLARVVYYILQKDVSSLFKTKLNYAVVGSNEEANEINSFLSKTGLRRNYIGYISKQELSDENYLGKIHQLEEIVKVHKPNEIIFASDSLENKDIIEAMSTLSGRVDFKIAPKGFESIIGSHSKSTAGDLYTIDVGFKISQLAARRNKRTLDLFVGIFTLFLSPILMLLKKEMVLNVFDVLWGSKSWVGYNATDENISELPKIKMGVFYANENIQNPLAHKANLAYAKEYSVWDDVAILFKNLWK